MYLPIGVPVCIAAVPGVVAVPVKITVTVGTGLRFGFPRFRLNNLLIKRRVLEVRKLGLRVPYRRIVKILGHRGVLQLLRQRRIVYALPGIVIEIVPIVVIDARQMVIIAGTAMVITGLGSSPRPDIQA